jgi:hypothetical protein
MNAYDVLGTTPGATLVEIEQAFIARLREVRTQPALGPDHDPTLPIVTAFRLAMAGGAHRFEPADVATPAPAGVRVVETALGGRRLPASGFVAHVPAAA